MANLSHPVREDPSESRAPTLRSPKGEQDRSALSKAEMGEALKCGGVGITSDSPIAGLDVADLDCSPFRLRSVGAMG
ncbi:MAG: hypothetical protein ACI8RZ_007007 [Myxococcota bacterium]|jgi:hypothetical protein